MGRRHRTQAIAKAVEKPTTAAASPMAEIGVSGLKISSGRIDDEIQRQLKTTKQAQDAFREMRENSPIVGAMLLATEQLMRRVKLFVKAGSDDQEGQKAKMLVETGLDDMSASWADTLTEELTALPYGWAWLETVYKKRGGDTQDPSTRSRYNDGLIGWRKWALRAQETLDKFDFDDAGGVRAMVQRDPRGSRTFTIPIEKSQLFRTTTQKQSPVGRSLLRNAFFPFYYAKKIQTFEAVGIERDLAGYPVVMVPAKILTATSGPELAARETYLKLATGIKRDESEGAVLPSDCDDKGNRLYEIKLLTSGGQRAFDTSKVIERYERRIAMTMLADFILMGHEKVGSFSLADSKTDIFAVAVAGWLDSFIAVTNRHEIPRLLRLNGMSVANPPVIEHGDIEELSLAELGAYLTALMGSGAPIWPNPELEERVLAPLGVSPTDLDTPTMKRNGEWFTAVTEGLLSVEKAADEVRKIAKSIEKTRPARKRARVKA